SGFKESIGDYILCVDSDDYVSSNYVEIFMNAKKEYPNFGHYWSGIQMIHKDSNMIERYVYCEDEKYSFYDRNHIQTIMNKLPGLGPYAKLYKREVVEKYYLRMDENITLGEDELFNYEYLDKNINHKILLINETPYCYVRSNDGTLDTKYYPNLLDMLSSNNDVIEEYLKKWQVNKSQWKLFYNSKFYCYERIMKNTFRKENTLSFYGKLKFNSNIMISTDYRLTLSYFTGYMHPLYKWAYTSNSYIFVIIVELLVIIKKKLS
ncbi:MAG: glycosyltransferase, partial [Faecalibacillus sp.]